MSGSGSVSDAVGPRADVLALSGRGRGHGGADARRAMPDVREFPPRPFALRPTRYLFGTTQPGPGYVAVKPEAVFVPPFENSGCTQKLPLVV
jgi:hypothetical protein